MNQDQGKTKEELSRENAELRCRIAELQAATLGEARMAAASHFNRIVEAKPIDDKLRLIDFFVEHAGEAVFWLSERSEFVYANKAACVMLGYSRDELK